MPAIIAFFALIPLLALGIAFFRALLLFWPTMLLFGAVHSHLPWVPNLSATATFLVIALISILIPSNTDTNKD
jgi:hypothetical protein